MTFVSHKPRLGSYLRTAGFLLVLLSATPSLAAEDHRLVTGSAGLVSPRERPALSLSALVKEVAWRRSAASRLASAIALIEAESKASAGASQKQLAQRPSASQ